MYFTVLAGTSQAPHSPAQNQRCLTGDVLPGVTCEALQGDTPKRISTSPKKLHEITLPFHPPLTLFWQVCCLFVFSFSFCPELYIPIRALFFLDFPFSSCSLITRRSLSSLTVFLFRKTFTSSAGTTVAHLSHVCQFRLHGVQACKRHPVVTISPVSRCLMMMCHLDLDSVSATHLVRLQGHSVGRLTLSLCWTALYLPSTTLI